MRINTRCPDAKMPDADTDVLIWDGVSPEATLGAYVGHDAEDGSALWVDAQGASVKVIAWAELPQWSLQK